jgi:hypothetical protein
LAITIAVESPLQDEVRTLIAELNAVLLTLSPPEACYHLTVEEMAEPTVTVWIARDGDTIIGCGALKRHFETVGEVKRMFTRPKWQVWRGSFSRPATGIRLPGPFTRRPAFPAAAPCSTIRHHPIPCSIKSSFALPDPK